MNAVDSFPGLIGRRIHVIGNSCAGKSTLAVRLARDLDAPLVELDALNWLPNWVGLNATNPAEFERRIATATAGDAWIVAGSYTGFCQRIFWPRLQTLVWLDPPLPLILVRMFRRSWGRWRSRELLWGTNYERFWAQLMVWRKQDSLLWWIVTQHGPKRRRMREYMNNPAYSHINFVRLGSTGEVERFLATLQHQGPAQPWP